MHAAVSCIEKGTFSRLVRALLLATARVAHARSVMKHCVCHPSPAIRRARLHEVTPKLLLKRGSSAPTVKIRYPSPLPLLHQLETHRDLRSQIEIRNRKINLNSGA